MPSKLWPKIIENSAEPERAQQFLQQLQSTSAASVLKTSSAEKIQILVALFSGSQALSELLIAHPDWLASLEPEKLKFPRQEQTLRRDVNAWLKPALKSRDYIAAFGKIREFKQREMLRIATRDLARLTEVSEITREISDIADICLDTVFQLCSQQLIERFGAPYHRDADERWQPTAFCVLGMGKLGGQELNYSSDVDVLFVYSDEGNVFKTPPKKTDLGKGLSNHQFFIRLGEMFIAEVSRMTPEGMLFRIDLRLRPEGGAGPLARSLESYENYYAQWGQTWERMMLIKARGVAGDVQLAAEFLETIQPFRFPRSLNERVLHEIAAVKQRIETEVVKSGELERNVKLGRGGIREIEFVAQTLQILHAGKIPFLQSTQTVPTLQKLVQYNLFSQDDAADLTNAYFFLRDVEHRLQMENNQQTHTIPTERKYRERLAALMGFDSLAAFEKAHERHRENVRRVYDKLLKTDKPLRHSDFPDQFSGNENEWKSILANHSFRDADQAFRLIQIFVEGPGYVHVSPRTIELARELLPKFFALCPSRIGETQNSKLKTQNFLSDPDRVLARLDSFIGVYGTRALLYELWTTNPSLFELLIWLFDRSEFLAEIAIRTPDLVDELVLSGRLRRQKTAPETLKDLRHGIKDEDQRLWLRKYHHAELMRIGLRDILGLADFEQNLTELSALADACLQYALEVVLRKNKFSKPPFAIIGMGKLGGAEINYGSDLDIIFVADAKMRNLPALQKLAVEVMDLISLQTEAGIVFQTDARLRPDGEKGLLVNTIGAYEEYYRQRAQLWEIQSLTRIRAIAGDEKVGKQFQELASALTDLCQTTVAASRESAVDLEKKSAALSRGAATSSGLAAFTPDWKKEIARMRQRIEKERTPVGKDSLAIKTGAGGLIDAEFIAQTLCLEHGWREPNTLKALQLGLEKKALAKGDGETLIENYRQLRRIEGILRRWSFAGETMLPDEDAPLYRVAVRCGFKTTEEFMNAVKKFRAAIRSVYENFFNK